MTTVAWDGETLACDTRMVGSYIHQYEARKVFRANGALIAGAGTYEDVLTFVDWYKRGADVESKPSLTDDSTYLVIRDGEAWKCGPACRLHQVGAPHAIGSGCCEAMGAMLAGASAKQAVLIAMKLDQHTGGKVRTYRSPKEKI